MSLIWRYPDERHAASTGAKLRYSKLDAATISHVELKRIPAALTRLDLHVGMLSQFAKKAGRT